jgi:hypothetical protein
VFLEKPLKISGIFVEDDYSTRVQETLVKINVRSLIGMTRLAPEWAGGLHLPRWQLGFSTQNPRYLERSPQQREKRVSNVYSDARCGLLL